MALNRAELTRLKDMIESRVSQLLLFKLYVECDGCGGEDGPLVLAAHEGTHEFHVRLGSACACACACACARACGSARASARAVLVSRHCFCMCFFCSGSGRL